MEDEDYFRRTVAAICETRAAAAAGLRDRGWQVLDSATNFLFARPPPPARRRSWRSCAGAGC